ncbi:MAG: InlB B-repeat-containing protein, partial [Terriglobales bacterium]
WPTTSPDAMPVPWVSTLNVPTGAVTANAAIVPAGQNGAISVLATSDTDVLIDINGYFAPSTSPNDLSLYTVPPCRVRDTRENTGLFSTTPLAIDTTAAACGIISTAAAIVVNATVVPATTLGFLTLWADGQTQPNVSTLNASEWPGFVTSNMAILPTRSAVIDAYGSSPTHLVLDTTGYFAPGTAPAPTTHVLTVTRSGSGTGTVTSTDGKISCGTFCAATYVSTTFVTLTASATQGSSFAGWSGGGCSGTGSCTVGLSASVSVTAVFNPPPPKAQGVYSGGSSNGFSFETIVLPNDKIYGIYGIVSGNVFYLAGMVAGQGTSSNGSFAATVTDYYYTGASYGGSVTGSYVAGVSINGTLLEYGVGTTSFWGTAMPTSVFNFDTPATVSRISGSWTGTLLDGTTATARIYSNGAFTGNDSGCSFSGAVSPDSSNKNFFNVTLTFGGSPCLLPYQTFSGIAVDSLLADGVTRQLLVGVTSGSYGTVFFSSSHGP